MADEETVAPVMTEAQTEAYKAELRVELADLEFAQYVWPTEYKADRIDRLRQRLGIVV